MSARSQSEYSSDSSSTSKRSLSSGKKDNNYDMVKVECNWYVEVGGGSCQGVGKGIAKKTWAGVLVDHRPTQSLAQTDSIPDFGPHSNITFSEKAVEANVECVELVGWDLELELVGQHAKKEIIQLEIVQSPTPIEDT
ncbi:hypothetical protein V6N11_030671 [Hibiscus sabdariffa]|uniref:Uncharacterized protein n=2 Tax=Hibiscus sabdariffa TaxID=183260 RepID=A0ABR2ADX3_9ROSI